MMRSKNIFLLLNSWVCLLSCVFRLFNTATKKKQDTTKLQPLKRNNTRSKIFPRVTLIKKLTKAIAFGISEEIPNKE